MGRSQGRRDGNPRSGSGAQPDTASSRWLRWLRWLGIAIAGFVVASLFGVVLFRFVDPPVTPLMVIRVAEGLLAGAGSASTTAGSRPLVSPALLRSVIAAEDAGFFRHGGVDWEALRKARAWNARHAAGRIRGASTITMQCARNVFLWQGRTYVRKALESGSPG